MLVSQQIQVRVSFDHSYPLIDEERTTLHTDFGLRNEKNTSTCILISLDILNLAAVIVKLSVA